VFFNRLGEMRDRSFENQRYRASGLNLVTAAIVLWNTVYLERAIQAIKDRGETVDDYVWRQDRRIQKGKFRPLRPFASA
jgi:TnpA family transposase